MRWTRPATKEHYRRLLAAMALSVFGAWSCSAPRGDGEAWDDFLLERDTAIDITHVEVVLPQAGDVELVERYCVACHSLRYIEMQPAMSPKQWEQVVAKMIDVYGAPVRDSGERQRIISYLAAIKSTP